MNVAVQVVSRTPPICGGQIMIDLIRSLVPMTTFPQLPLIMATAVSMHQSPVVAAVQHVKIHILVAQYQHDSECYSMWLFG